VLVAGSTDVNGGNLDFLVARFLEDGSPDPSFGTNGVSTPSLTDGSDTASDVLLLNDGRIVVVGNSASGSAPGPIVARYRDDGTLDPTFGSGGVVRPTVGTEGGLQRVIAGPDQRKVYISGYSSSFPQLALILRMWM
jgi:uncharacterized delta-60 repeat protein